MEFYQIKYFLLSIFVQLLPLLRAEENSNENDDADDYNWDYADDSEVRPKLSKSQLLSLTRDWLGREDPDMYPTHGFFPVWGFALIIIAAFFFVLTIITGLCHVMGCKGRRPVVKSNERKQSVSLLDKKLIDRNRSTSESRD